MREGIPEENECGRGGREAPAPCQRARGGVDEEESQRSKRKRLGTGDDRAQAMMKLFGVESGVNVPSRRTIEKT